MVITIIVAMVASIPAAWWSTSGSGSSDDSGPDSIRLESPSGSIALNRQSEGTLLATTGLESLGGDVISTTALLGQPLIVNFWYSTCEPCRREFPVLADAHAQYGDVVRFVGVNINDSAETTADFAARYGARFEQYRDPNGVLTTAMGIATAPVTLFIDAGGIVVRQVAGEITAVSLAATMREAFAL
jgi:thiol-disulfide isomerase/thioredoxin